MSAGVARCVLWAVLVLVVPLPFYLVQTGTVPLARIGMLAGVLVALVAAEGPQGTAGILTAILVAQAFAYAAILWGAAHGISRLLARAWPRRIGLATAALALVCLLAAASFDVYRTPFRTRSLRADLLEVFE